VPRNLVSSFKLVSKPFHTNLTLLPQLLLLLPLLLLHPALTT
jgi:hypothetical protein